MFQAFERHSFAKVVKNHHPSSNSSFRLNPLNWLFCCLVVLFTATASAQVQVNPLTTWQEQTGNNLHRLKTEGEILYATALTQGLAIYDIANPLRPYHLATYKGGTNSPFREVWDLEVKGGLVYLSDDTNGIVVLDVSDPTNIMPLVSRFPLPDEPLGICLMGDLLYVAADTAGLVILDVSEARSGILRQVGQYDTPGIAFEVIIAGHVAYVVDGTGGIQIIDVSNPAQPAFLGEFKKESYYNAAIYNGNLYAVGRPNLLTVINVTDPTVPQLVTEYTLPFTLTGFSQHIQIHDGIAYIPDTSDNLVVVDVRNPALPVTTSINRWEYGLTATVIADNQIWVGGGFGLNAGDLSEPLFPKKIGIGIYMISGVSLLEARGHLNFLRTHNLVFRIVDTSIPDQPIAKDAYESTETIQTFAIDGDRAYLVGNPTSNNSKLTILDISDTSNIQLIDRSIVTTNFFRTIPKSFEVKDNLLIATSSGKDITIMDISDPKQPVTLLDGYQNRRLASVTRHDNHLYGISSDSKLEIYDITTPSSPQLIGQSTETISGQNVKVEGNNFYAWNTGGNLRIADISNPTNPVVSGTYTGQVRNAKVIGDFAYLAEGANGLTVINISNPAEPQFVINYPNDNVQNLAVFENIVLTSGNTNKALQLLETFGLNQATPSILPRSFSMVDGQPQFEFRTGLPVTYAIESTTDFQTWVPAGSVTATNSRTRFSPTATSVSGEFYRVRSP